MTGKFIHVLGTSSNAGKTTLTMAICRILKDKGFKVAPFKAMNMSLNSVSTQKGEEISRAQWLQAKASGIEPDWRMNPILLKPEGMGKSQVICRGTSLGEMTVEQYGEFLRNEGRKAVREALSDLLRNFEYVIGEGSGSCAEVNLYDRDISNTWLTDEFKGKGILVTNIEFGGAFGSLYGTKKIAQYPDTISYFVINNMRGNHNMLQSGIEFIENETGMKCLGVIPHLENHLPGEDSLDYIKQGRGNVGVIRYPFFENYSDVDFLSANGLFRYVTTREDMDGIKTILLPGSKNVRNDMEFLKETGLWDKIIEFHRQGGMVIGICGGYQIISKKVTFHNGEEPVNGLGLLNTEFTYSNVKTVQMGEYSSKLENLEFHGTGYEIRYGQIVKNSERPFLLFRSRKEGSISQDGRVIGTNVHGILSNRDFLEYVTGLKLKETYDELLERNIMEFSSKVSANLKTTILSQIINGH
ncbi:cobyric acid synthase [Cuniculiplasma sp. SKW3]|uniref:cobyric acid synthase n=1 Tax=Cuniculiplasma sp. SKW3 TaxID=3400170 RepID=UPI003FD2982D